MPVNIYLSYAPDDKDAALRLVRHLTPWLRQKDSDITLWHRGLVDEGEVPEQVRQHLASAQIILLLVSPDLEIDNDEEVTQALEQRARGARVVPVLVRDVNLEDLRYATLKMIPDGKPILTRKSQEQDAAWVQVVQAIRRVKEAVQKSPSPSQFSAPPSPLIKLLFMAANPFDSTRLALAEEARDIDKRIRQGGLRDRFQFEQAFAVTDEDLIQTLEQHRPVIVHFSGHGSKAGELILQDLNRRAAPVSAEALDGVFALYASQGLRCVVLNACYSVTQAQAIVSHIDFVVGMSDALTDIAAAAFSSGFYTGLANGRTVQDAVAMGRAQIKVMKQPGSDLPQLLTRAGVNAATQKLV